MFKRTFTIFLLILVSVVISTGQERLSTIAQKLVHAGFENIRIAENDDTVFVNFENNVFRWNIDGMRAAIDTVSKYADKNQQIHLFFSVQDIPRILIEVSVEDWLNYSDGKITASDISGRLKVSYAGNGLNNLLKKVLPLNPSVNKIDFVFYPQLSLQNTLLSKIYEVQFNIAPAAEVSLWKGMLFTGQVIFPVYVDPIFSEDNIRPGFITLAQEFRLPQRWFGRVVAGNFNANRYGANITVNHPLKNNRWEIELNAGATGSSHFYDGRWLTGEIKTLTWQAGVQYFYPKYNLQLNLGYGRYLNKDYGFRADCTRHFGATTVGFYAMYTGGETNGGFHFSAPLPPFERKRRRSVRLVPAKYFDWEYNAGTEFYYGRYYETRPNENRSEQWINPEFIKNEILKPMKK